MIKATKSFDCLAMKREIQGKLHKKWALLTTEEIQAAIANDLATSQSELARWWRKMQKKQANKDDQRS